MQCSLVPRPSSKGSGNETTLHDVLKGPGGCLGTRLHAVLHNTTEAIIPLRGPYCIVVYTTEEDHRSVVETSGC